MIEIGPNLAHLIGGVLFGAAVFALIVLFGILFYKLETRRGPRNFPPKKGL